MTAITRDSSCSYDYIIICFLIDYLPSRPSDCVRAEYLSNTASNEATVPTPYDEEDRRVWWNKNWQGKTKVLGEKSGQVPFRTP